MHVVVWDPSGEYWEGGLVDDEAANVLRTRRVAVLPIEPSLIRRSGASGFFKRAWGAGWPIGFTVPTMCCPMVLHCSNADNLQTIHWCARLVPENEQALQSLTDRLKEGGKLNGMLRLAGDSGQPGATSGGFSATAQASVKVEQLGMPDEDGGWTVGGQAKINMPGTGHLGLGLWGSVPGLAVAWAAVSQSR